MSESPWLDDAEQTAWRTYLRATHLLTASLDAQVTRDSHMPLAHYIVLAMLSEAPDRSLRMTELAALTQSSRSRLSHAVARLEERGWVERRECREDRRGQLAVLTDAGWDVLVAAAPGHSARVRAAVFDRLGPADVAALTRIMATIADGLEAELKDSGGDRSRPVPASGPAPAPALASPASGPATA